LIPDITHGNLLPVNISLALQALVSAGFAINAKTCQEALKCLSLPGRQQRVKFQGVDLLLDVAHNPAAARVLAAKISIIQGTTYAVASVLNDKDWAGIVAEIHLSVDVWLLGKITDNHRAMETQRLLEVVYNSGAEAVCFESVELAFDRAVQLTSPGDQVVVFGSFHTVSAVLTIISKEG
jgi:dihydrofolate synthase/folylpolyglutamate synthase